MSLCEEIWWCQSKCGQNRFFLFTFGIRSYYLQALTRGQDGFSPKGGKLFGRGPSPLEVLGFIWICSCSTLTLLLLYLWPHMSTPQTWVLLISHGSERQGGFNIHTLLHFSAPLLTFFCPRHPVFSVAVTLMVNLRVFIATRSYSIVHLGTLTIHFMLSWCL